MGMSEDFLTVVLIMLVAVMLVLVQQSLRINELWRMAQRFKKDVRWVQILEMEKRELRSSLRDEKERVEMLEKKLVVLQELIPTGE